MSKIKTIYVCNHAHTDIGFTDYQDVWLPPARRVHRPGARPDRGDRRTIRPRRSISWTCETTGPLLRYLRQAEPGRDRPLPHWHEQGRIDVAAMQYNLTPLLNVEQMHRSLYPLRALRDEFGLTVESAMQDDVNGVSWLFADLLADARRLVLHRRHQPDPRRAAEAVPRRLLVGGAERQEGAGLERLPLSLRPQPGRARQLGPGRPAAAALGRAARGRPRPTRSTSSTANRRIRCASTTARRTRACRISSSAGTARTGRTRWQFVTATEFGRLLASRSRQRHRHAARRLDRPLDRRAGLERLRDRRQPRHARDPRHRPRAIEAWLPRPRAERTGTRDRAADTYENDDALRRAHLGRLFLGRGAGFAVHAGAVEPQGGFAYTAAMEAHDQLARAANTLAAPLGTKGPEGIFNLGDLDPKEAFKPSGIDELLVINTLPWERKVIVEEPEPRGGAAPVGMLDCFFNRGSSWGGARPDPAGPPRRRHGPGDGLCLPRPIARRAVGDLKAGGGTIENRHYRITVDPQDRRPRSSSSTRRWATISPASTKAGGPGSTSTRTVDLPRRPARHRQHRLRTSRLLHRPQGHARGGARRATKVTVGEPTINEGRASITVAHRGPRRPRGDA